MLRSALLSSSYDFYIPIVSYLLNNKMGGVISSNMEKVAQKQMEFQQQAQKMQMDRQIEMQNQMRIRMQAVAVARARDMFTYTATMYGLLGIGLTGAAIRKRNGALIAPLIPLSVVFAYNYDLAWGNKMERIVGWAEEIIEHEPHLLGSPFGMPSADDVDRAIKARAMASADRK